MKNLKNFLIKASFQEDVFLHRKAIDFYSVLCIYSPLPSYLSLLIKNELVSFLKIENENEIKIKDLESNLSKKSLLDSDYEKIESELFKKIEELAILKDKHSCKIVYDFVSYYYDKNEKFIDYDDFLSRITSGKINQILSFLLDEINSEYRIVEQMSENILQNSGKKK